MSDVFISYAREDRDAAFKLAQALRSHGVNVWWDFDLVGGEDFRSRIREVIDSAPKVLVLWSKVSVKSAFVIDEAAEAKRQGKLVPISLDRTSPPFGFGDLHTIALERDFSNLSQVLGSVSGAAAAPSVARRTRRTIFPWLAGAGLTAVAATSGWIYSARPSLVFGPSDGGTPDVSPNSPGGDAEAVEPGRASVPRLAFVIGNANYETLGQLGNPARDVDLISKALAERGFNVVTKLDLRREELAAVIRDFEKSLSFYGGVGLFYYAGRAAYVDGKDIMMPVDMKIDIESGQASGGVILNELQAEVKAETTTAFEDDGTAVIYSASEGQRASDGPPGDNSPFAKAFVQALASPGAGKLVDVFTSVRSTMKSKCANKDQSYCSSQTPYMESSASIDFYFNDASRDKHIGAFKILIFDSCRDNPYEGKIAFR